MDYPLGFFCLIKRIMSGAMRKRLTSILCLLLVSVLLSALGPHCLFDDDAIGTGSKVTVSSHGFAPMHDYDGNKTDVDCCAARADLEAGKVPQGAATSPPQVKHLIVWPVFRPVNTFPLVAGYSHPFFGPAPRASPAYAAAFARTSRRII